jgi:chaperonin GroES
MTINIRPINDCFYVQQDPVKDKIGSGLLFAPQGSEEWPPIGTVIAVGPGRRDERGELVPLEVKVGDRVMFRRRASSALHPDSREVDERGLFGIVRLQEDDLVGIVEEE